MTNRSKTYQKFRRLLPMGAKGIMTRLLYILKLKPSVNKRSETMLKKGIVVISADFEMAWAFRYSKKNKNAVEKGLLERKNLPVILKILDDNKVPITWATVGHLFLDKCAKHDGLAHVNMPRPDYFENKNWLFQQGDWYQHDPGTNLEHDPAWYASDLIDLIIASQIPHEIGCHTFSHIDFTDKNCSPELAKAELAACKTLAENKGIHLRSMVFPGGTAGNYKILKEEGFTNYRKPMAFDIDYPFIDDHGLVAIPSGLGLDKPPYNWSAQTCFKHAKACIDKAIKHRMICHLWFHPSMHPWYLENVFPAIIDYLRIHVDTGKVEIKTMEQIARDFTQHPAH